MRKALVTLNIGRSYLPEIYALTKPFMEIWARKIGAEFVEITDRQYPTIPIVNYEKFQLQAITSQYDWTYFLDSDALVLPDTPDWAEQLNDKSKVIFSGVDNLLDRFAPSGYTRRSGSKVGACTWNVICSDWTGPDLWTPPQDFAAACGKITPMWQEAKTGMCVRDHLIDDYQLSQNIARFGLKVETINNLCAQMGRAAAYYVHLYNCCAHDKLKAIRERLDSLGISYA